MTKPELKPCPWCGVVPEVEVFEREDGSKEDIIYMISCGGEGCSVYCHTEAYGTEEETANAWNRRKP